MPEIMKSDMGQTRFGQEWLKGLANHTRRSERNHLLIAEDPFWWCVFGVVSFVMSDALPVLMAGERFNSQLR